jgi:hypothetical protein
MGELMIVYLTKQTIERYSVKVPMEYDKTKVMIADIVEKEKEDKLFEWGAKLFYFERKKCIQLVNFETKLTFFIFDIKVKEFNSIGKYLINSLYEIYKDKLGMEPLLEKYIQEAGKVYFLRLKDKSIISTLNATQRIYVETGSGFYYFIQEKILNATKINRHINFKWVFTRKEGKKTDYFTSGERFEEILRKRYGQGKDYVSKISKIGGEPLKIIKE